MKLRQINEFTNTAYDKTAVKYHVNFKNEIEQKEYDRLLLERFSSSLNKNSLVCDAGCGPSVQAGKYLLGKGHRIIGIDISKRCIDIASSYMPEIDFKVMDMIKTDFKNDTFDGIISFYSIIHTPKKYLNKMFAEFNRILKPQGKLLVVVKKGIGEGIIDDDWYEGNKIYFTNFLEYEIINLITNNNFKFDFLDTRRPYDFEFKVERIYAIGIKIS